MWISAARSAGPSHGEGVTAIHLAAQSGRREAVTALLELGADPLIQDKLHGGNALGWARSAATTTSRTSSSSNSDLLGPRLRTGGR